MYGHQKKPALTKFYSLFKLTALCAQIFHEAAALPLKDTKPPVYTSRAANPTAPVACGRPGHCTETTSTGLKALNELHEVRFCNTSTPSR